MGAWAHQIAPTFQVVGGGRAGVPDGHLMERTALGALESPGAQLALGMAGSTAHLRCGGFWGPRYVPGLWRRAGDGPG